MTGRPGLYLDDKQIADELGIPVAEWRENAAVLTQDGLPAPNPLFGNRRYWPAVRAFLDRLEGLGTPSDRPRRISRENLDAEPQPRRRAGTQKAHAH